MQRLWLLAGIMIGLTLVMILQLPARAQQRTPTPLPTLKREPYSPRTEPPVEQIPPLRDRYVQSQETPVQVEIPPMRLVRLPPGVVSCSFDPQGRQLCGRDVWLPQ